MKAIQAQALAGYNHWMNRRLYEVCESLSEEECKCDREAFFKSIHGTLNHILVGDRIWLGRFRGVPFQVQSLDEELYASFETLRAAREKTDQEIIEWVGTLTDESLLADFDFSSFASPKKRRCQLWVTVTHFFNHQTHHRGQTTTLLSQYGLDCGTTDFIWTGDLVYELD